MGQSMEASFLETGYIPHVFGIRCVKARRIWLQAGYWWWWRGQRRKSCPEEGWVLSVIRGCALGPQVEKNPPFCPSLRSDEDSHSFSKRDLSDYKSLKALLRFLFKGLKCTHKAAQTGFLGFFFFFLSQKAWPVMAYRNWYMILLSALFLNH